MCNILRSLSLPHNALFLSQRLSSSALPHGSSSYLLSFANVLYNSSTLSVYRFLSVWPLNFCSHVFFPSCGPIRYRILITTLCSCFELFCIDHFCPTSKSRRVEWLCNSKSCKAVQSMWKMSGVTQIYYFRRMIFHPQVNSEDIDVWGSIKYFGQLLDKTAADNKLTVLWNIIVL